MNVTLRKKVGVLAQRLGVKKLLICAYDRIRSAVHLVAYLTVGRVKDRMTIRKMGTPRIMSIDETIVYIINRRSSVCRYGDGEFNAIDGAGLGFQISDTNLSEKLLYILKNPQKNCLICLPGILQDFGEYDLEKRFFWGKLLSKKRCHWYTMLNPHYLYGNADITRCYMGLRDKSKAKGYFHLMKSVWNNRSILLVEGEKSRLGIGNDLFANAESVRRILCPAINAFEEFDRIVACVIKHAIPTDLILIALGPTATVLAYELSQKGYQAIDIGNIDNEYEWYLAGAKRKKRNPMKFSMEVKGGSEVDRCDSATYINSIIGRIN